MTAVLERQPAGSPRDLPGMRRLRAFGTGFAWTCRSSEAERGRVVRACHHVGVNRDDYAAHQKTHGRKMPRSAYRRWEPWTPPRPVKTYDPKPGDAGQRITWGKVADGHWVGREFDQGRVTVEGTWVPWACEERTGTIWSAGTTQSEVWVCPDDDPQRPVLVKRQGKGYSRDAKEGDLREVTGYGEAARLAVLRGEKVRRLGIYPVVDLVFTDRRVKKTYLKWHTDPGCPKAAGKERYDAGRHGIAYGYSRQGLAGEGPWLPVDVAAALTRMGQVPSELCEQCITGLDVEEG